MGFPILGGRTRAPQNTPRCSQGVICAQPIIGAFGTIESIYTVGAIGTKEKFYLTRGCSYNFFQALVSELGFSKLLFFARWARPLTIFG